MEFVKERIESAFSVKSFEHWHAAFGHVGPTSLRQKHLFEDGHILPTPPTTFHCEPCILAKSTHSIPKSSERKTTAPFELIHSDLNGHFPVKSIEGFEYYLTIIHDYLHASWIYFLKKKSEAAKAIKDFCLMLKRQHPQYSFKRVRTDNRTEYINDNLTEFFKGEGIIHELTSPYHYESLGAAERYNWTIIIMVRSMEQRQKQLWPYMCATAIYLKNQLPHSAVKDRTLYEVLYGKKPMISHLQPFSIECFIHILEEARPSGSKLQLRAEKGWFVGYTESTKIFIVYIPSKRWVVRSGDVYFPTSTNSEGVQSSSTPTPPTTPASPPPPPATTTTTFTEPVTQPMALIPYPEFPSTENWRRWCNRNLLQATQWWVDGHPEVKKAWDL